MEIFSREMRANIMRGSKSKNTKPEKIVRSRLHALGYRFRLHGKGLSGRPDLVFSARRMTIFVHGCFWHQHDAADCIVTRKPSSNSDYWEAKFERNRQRDQRVVDELREMGWSVLTIWECEIAEPDTAIQKITEFLGPPKFRGRPAIGHTRSL